MRIAFGGYCHETNGMCDILNTLDMDRQWKPEF